MNDYLRRHYYKYKSIYTKLPDNERNKIAVIVLLISFILLIPGLFEPVLTISAKMAGLVIFQRTKSIFGNITSLFEAGYYFVAILILLFSVIVPVTKAILLLIALYMKDTVKRYKLYHFIGVIGKWSMADVFLVGIFVAYLAAKAIDNLYAAPLIGFYFFAAYCLLSIVSHKIMVIRPPLDKTKN